MLVPFRIARSLLSPSARSFFFSCSFHSVSLLFFFAVAVAAAALLPPNFFLLRPLGRSVQTRALSVCFSIATKAEHEGERRPNRLSDRVLFCIKVEESNPIIIQHITLYYTQLSTCKMVSVVYVYLYVVSISVFYVRTRTSCSGCCRGPPSPLRCLLNADDFSSSLVRRYLCLFVRFLFGVMCALRSDVRDSDSYCFLWRSADAEESAAAASVRTTAESRE